MRHRAEPRPGRRPLAAAALVLVLLGAATLATVVSVTVGAGRARPSHLPAAVVPEPAPRPPARRAVAPPERSRPDGRALRWRHVLVTLDRRRARAYATADPSLLRGVYAAGSRVLALDRRLLLRYRRMGLRVHDLRMRVLDVGVVATRPRDVVLRVREHVAAGRVTGRGRRRPLGHGAVETRAITLRRGAPGASTWRISAVRRL